MSYQSRNPFNGKVLKTYDDLSDQALESAVSGAEQVYEVAWSKEPMRQRAAVELPLLSTCTGCRSELVAWQRDARKARVECAAVRGSI